MRLLDLWYQNLSLNQKYQLARTTTSHHLQKLLASDDNYNVRWCLSDNPSLHPDAQKILARDTNPDVRIGLADNPSLTKEAKGILNASN